MPIAGLVERSQFGPTGLEMDAAQQDGVFIGAESVHVGQRLIGKAAKSPVALARRQLGDGTWVRTKVVGLSSGHIL